MHLYLATDLSPAHPDERLGPDEDEHLRLAVALSPTTKIYAGALARLGPPPGPPESSG